MHASHIAILVLASSAASPVFSAPLAARGAAGVPATSDVVARGFSTSVSSNVNEGTKAVKRDGPLDVIQVSDTHVKDIISVMKGLFGDGPVDDVQARDFDTSIFSDLNKGTQALGARGFDLSAVKGILGTVISSLLVRDDVDDIQARGFETSILSNVIKGTQALGARALIRPSDVKAIIGTVKDLAGLLRRDDVDDPVLEDAFLQAISRRGVSELGTRGQFSSVVFQAIKDIAEIISRRDVAPEQMIALASLASSGTVAAIHEDAPGGHWDYSSLAPPSSTSPSGSDRSHRQFWAAWLLTPASREAILRFFLLRRPTPSPDHHWNRRESVSFVIATSRPTNEYTPVRRMAIGRFGSNTVGELVIDLENLVPLSADRARSSQVRQVQYYGASMLRIKGGAGREEWKHIYRVMYTPETKPSASRDSGLWEGIQDLGKFRGVVASGGEEKQR
ncbi:hypothetical protein EDB87DRAFT_1577438 [Lactarius vividus]|nr:hypothetical protein EDB87DRAFT_1577438 [Lactarius vividus]